MSTMLANLTSGSVQGPAATSGKIKIGDLLHAVNDQPGGCFVFIFAMLLYMHDLDLETSKKIAFLICQCNPQCMSWILSKPSSTSLARPAQP